MNKKIKENTIVSFTYEKNVGNDVEVTDRVVIPTYVPKFNIKALDVTHLTDEQRNNLIELHKNYQQYVKEKMRNMYSFEDWIASEHPKETGEEVKSIKYRTFKMDNIDYDTLV